MRIAVILALIQLNFGQFPDSEYCSISCTSGPHTMCFYEPIGPNCREIKNLMDERRRKKIISLHNRFRDAVADGKEFSLPQSSNMRQLYWDLELEAIAERWAMQCNGSYPDKCRDVARFKVGQIMSKSKIMSTDLNYYDTLFGKLWFAEVGNLDVGMVKKYQQEKYVQHVAQILAATTSRIGCADVLYKTIRGNRPLRTTICNYGPTIEEDAEIYRVGTPCSDCPGQTECQGPQSKYPHLCSEFRRVSPAKTEDSNGDDHVQYDIANDMEIRSSIFGTGGRDPPSPPYYGGRAGDISDGKQEDKGDDDEDDANAEDPAKPKDEEDSGKGGKDKKKSDGDGDHELKDNSTVKPVAGPGPKPGPKPVPGLGSDKNNTALIPTKKPSKSNQ